MNPDDCADSDKRGAGRVTAHSDGASAHSVDSGASHPSLRGRWLLAMLLPPLVSYALESLLWPLISPSTWLLFVPAVLAAARLGGYWSGIGATFISCALVWWRFMPPEHSFVKSDARYFVIAGAFVAVGLALSLVQRQLRRQELAQSAALAESQRVARRLQQVLGELKMFAALVENSADFIGIGDMEGRGVYLNPAGRRMVGLAADFPIESTLIPDYYPPEQRAYALQLAEHMMKMGSWQGETSLRHFQTHELIPVSHTQFVIRDPQTGETLGAATITRDISEIKRARDEVEAANRMLQEANAKFSGIVAMSADAIISVEASGRITQFNSGAEKIFGYPQDEIVGRPLDVLIPQRFRAAHARHFQAFAAGAPSARRMGEGRPSIVGLRKSGEEFPADAAISKIEVAGASLMTVTVRDMTAQKRTEMQQRFLAEVGAVLASTLDYEETLNAIVRTAVRDFADFCTVDVFEEGGESLRIVVATRDPSLEWVCDILRRRPFERSATHPVWLALHGKRAMVTAGPSREMMASLTHDEEHLKALRDLDIESGIVAPLMMHGEVFGALAVANLRASGHFDQEDLQLAEALALRASLAIENARLYRAAQRAIRSRDELQAIIAHDLRSPLTSIMLNAELLRRLSGEAERRDTSAVIGIQESARRIDRMIQDLLDVTRIDAGRLTLEPGRVSTKQLVLDTVQSHALLADAAGVELRADLAADVPEIWGDRHRLLQVLDNLIGNAMKFTPRGGRITLGAVPSDGKVLLHVSDTGSGISADHLEHIFDRYWQARSRDRRGTGLGLAIVKGIVDAHGGSIWVESAAGRGTTIFFSLAMAPAREETLRTG